MKKNILLFAVIISIINKIDAQSTIKDIDGHVYNTVQIGTQLWMKENFRTCHLNDGTKMFKGFDYKICGYNWYGNDSISNETKYGKLYNWYCVETNKLCPIGWHVPDSAEWQTLIKYLIANGYNYDGSTTGNKIAKSLADTNYWATSTLKGTVGNKDYPTYRNKTGFSGLPGGTYLGMYFSQGTNGDWWTSSAKKTDKNYIYYMFLASADNLLIGYYNTGKTS